MLKEGKFKKKKKEEGKLSRKIWVIDTFLGLLNQATFRAKRLNKKEMVSV